MRRADEIAMAFADRSELKGRKRFFLVGIGGAGMSALARMLRHRGFEVVGTDSTLSPEVERLREEGFAVVVGHSGEAVADFVVVDAPAVLVLTDAIDLHASPEVAAAKANDVPIFRRSQVLGWLLSSYRVIAVTGTHGKTTTTGMTGSGLIAASANPLVVVGANIPTWGGPIREGEGGWAVVEACEAYDAFHDLDPTIVVLTNLEPDHLDYHGSWERLRESVIRFVRRLPADGVLVYCAEDAGACEVALLAGRPSIGYRLSDAPELPLASPGAHNRLNAAAALAVARLLRERLPEISIESAAQGIAGFRGAERRLQVLRDDERTVVDDYAHHPTEIAASIQALRERFPGRRLVVVFQPHLYSRTAEHLPEFAEALSSADLVVLTDIYPAREEPIPGVSSARIAEALTVPSVYVPSRHLLPRTVAARTLPGDVVVGMGAGNISEFSPAFIDELARRRDTEPLHVAVFAGGDSSEREVSLLSGRAVAAALRHNGHRVTWLDPAELLLRQGKVSALIGADRPDVVFLATHGTNAEDGATQGLLQLLHLPYVGSGVQASALAMDKALTKRILAAHGVRVPTGIEIRRPDEKLPDGPVVVKPNSQGSTVGLSFVEAGGDVRAAVTYALQYGSVVLVEEWIHGIEISVPVLIDRALPAVEIAPQGGKYDFARKYTPGATTEIVPARLPENVLREAADAALRAHRALGCAGATRTDMIYRPEDGALVALEVNTLPGMTSTSLLPNSARAAGIGFGELCEILVRDALARYAASA